MRKLAKKVLAVCLSLVMVGTMLSATAFAAQSDFTIFVTDGTYTDWSYSGNVYVMNGITVTFKGTCEIEGNVFVSGTLINEGSLNVTGTLHCLHYNDSMSAGDDYDYGYFINAGSGSIKKLDVTPGWLDEAYPDIYDDDDNDSDDGNDEPGTDEGAFSGQHVTVISGEETKTDWVISGVVYIPEDASLTTSGNVTIDGDVYVVGTLTNEGTLNITGTTYCLNFGGLSAGNYDYGYVYNLGSLSGHTMIVDNSFLSIDFPTSTVHIWGETEFTWNEDNTSATATRTCTVCGETETVDAEITEEIVETEDGETETVITATADFGDEEEGNGEEEDVAMESIVVSTEDEDEDGSNTSTRTTGTGSTGTGSSGSSGNSGSSGTGSTVTSPQTSDSTNITALWLIVACFGVASCVALVVYKVHGVKEQD